MTSILKLVLFGLVLAIVIGMIGFLPTISVDKNAVITSSAFQWIRAGLWFLPTGAMLAIFTVQLALWTFRFVISMVKTFWDMLPF